MNETFRRWLKVAGTTAFLGAVLTLGTGCGAIAAAANPKVAWAINDPAPMSVVVRRADVAEQTSKEVDRILTATPVNDDSTWVGKVGPEKEDATKQLGVLKQHDLYVGGARVVAAEVWAKSLHDIDGKTAGGTPPATVAVAPAPAPSPAPEPQPVAAKAAKKDVKKGGKKAKALAQEPAPAPAPAPPPAADPAPAAGAPKYESMLAAIDKELDGKWLELIEKKQNIGQAKGQIATLEAQNDEKSTSADQKIINKRKIKELDKLSDALEKEADKLAKEFIGKAKASAQKSSPEVREKLGAAIVNLRQAVDDANIANGAAAVRYPMAASSLLDSAQQMVKVYVADVIEEKTGKRPSTQGLQPGVTMEGGKVGVTLNGLSQSDMGKLNMGELTTEVASRTTKWVGHALSLLGSIASTKEILSLEEDVLDGLIDGFKAAGWSPPAPTTIPEAPAGPGGQPRS